MIELVQSFILVLREREHVLQLIRNTVLTVDLISEGKNASIALIRGEVHFSNHPVKNSDQCEIKGEVGIIKDLLEGKEKLRFMIKRGELHVSASFRTVLLLESLFYLAKLEEAFPEKQHKAV